MRNPILVIWRYFKNSWEDEMGHFSFKRASAFSFVFALLFMVLSNRVKDQWTFYTFLTLAVMFALTTAIITVPQLIRLIRYGIQAKQALTPPAHLYDGIYEDFHNEEQHYHEKNHHLPTSADGFEQLQHIPERSEEISETPGQGNKA